MGLLHAVDELLAWLEKRVVVLFLSCMVALTIAQVVLRALAAHLGLGWANDLLGRIAWTDPLVRALMLWLTFLGASLITRKNRHIRIDVLTALLPKRLLPARESILALATAVVCGLMAWASFQLVRLEMSFGDRMFLQVPTWAVQVIIPAGFLLLAFRFLVIALDPPRPDPEDEP